MLIEYVHICEIVLIVHLTCSYKYIFIFNFNNIIIKKPNVQLYIK